MTRTVLVKGSSRGLGATIARVLVDNGFKLVINYYKSKDAAEKLVSELGTENAIALYADVTKRQDVENIMQVACKRRGVRERPTIDKKMKKLVCTIFKAGKSAIDIAKEYEIGRATVYKIINESAELTRRF